MLRKEKENLSEDGHKFDLMNDNKHVQRKYLL